jgi:hypothetical protein
MDGNYFEPIIIRQFSPKPMRWSKPYQELNEHVLVVFCVTDNEPLTTWRNRKVSLLQEMTTYIFLFCELSDLVYKILVACRPTGIAFSLPSMVEALPLVPISAVQLAMIGAHIALACNQNWKNLLHKHDTMIDLNVLIRHCYAKYALKRYVYGLDSGGCERFSTVVPYVPSLWRPSNTKG